MTSKYENQSQQLYINSEGGFGSIGDQINKFKVDLNTSPFSNADDTILRCSLTQFNMTKNFYDVNENNNAVRICWKGYTDTGNTGKVVSNVDTIIRIPPGDYPTHSALISAFADKVKEVLDAAVADLTFTITNSIPKTYRNFPFDSTNYIDQPDATSEFENLRFMMTFTCSNTAFRFTHNPHFQCLSVATANALELGVTNADRSATLEPSEFYSDSFALLGGVRVEEYKAFNATLQQSFSVQKANHILRVANWFPMNNETNTMPYIYLRSRNSRTQASSNLEEGNNPHNHHMINSSLFAKIPRKVKRDGSVYYELENSPYFTNITQRQLNTLEFELTDHKGRELPQSSVGKDYTGNLTSTEVEALPSGVSISKNGNLFCDMVLLVEKFAFNNPSALVGFGSAPPPVNTNQFSENPTMTINNRICG